ncbi:alpha-(1,3)-fucosyltransferase C-like [Pomacea canaliculata]|uniref:alpha-(1,3)-fucosyltransferase C-like n=1 Tax=Pomacea canaliculata TaxID=400727 RepID=UPI000D73006E|nr:alpha-(1,3)-fucosyltransferase C-like [Pomacea canaliculata]XP_025088192.1 alpha-(1,3)-fucosyltransferase C-like [Pomacea canaliculata]XP_025088193.1 alpha-(1,3)-fucosyltransferase C-like [Pomacea canaliculata]
MMVDAPSWLRGSSWEFFGACPVSACALSYVRSNDNLTADAVVFHDVPEKLAVPQRTSPTQVYVFMHMESPVHTSDRYKSTLWNAAFNWTWSYRVDADIFCPVAYLKRAREVPTRAFLLSLRRNKTKAVAWFSSNCHVQSRRDEYVARLRRVIPVDIYGRCGSLQCTGPTCEQMLSTDYMFYLSYENSFCQDYVTEKFFRVFKENVYVVPVVRGGADYDKYFMRGVYVDSEWFESPEDLGRHLLELMEDEETYVDMLWRRAHFLYHEHGIVDAKCQLCHRLHNVHRFAKTCPDLYEWNHCDRCRPSPDF